MEELGTVRQQIGEILGTLRGLADQKDDTHRQNDRIISEMRTIKHDGRQTEQILASRLELLTSQIKELDEKTRGISTEIGSFKSNVKDSIAKLIDMKNQLMAYMLVFLSLTTIILYLIHPVLNSVIDDIVKKLF